MGYYENRRTEWIALYKTIDSVTQVKLKKELPRKEVTQEKKLYVSTFSSIQEEAKEFAKEWKKTLDDVRLEHTCYQPDYSDSYSSEVHLEVEDLETDQQYFARLGQHLETTKFREDHERKEFERLKAKFDK